MDINTLPIPTKGSIILLSCMGGFHYLFTLTHADVNLWLETIVGICAVFSYLRRVYKWMVRKSKKIIEADVDKFSKN